MDITIKTAEGRFNFRVCGIIINNNKILAMKDINEYYYLPGGRVQMNETVEEAVVREIKEELGLDVKIDRALWFNQAFFVEDGSKEKYHEVCVYFLIDYRNTDLLARGNEFEIKEEHKTNYFKWLDFEALADEYFYPIFLKREIFDLPKELKIITNYD